MEGGGIITLVVSFLLLPFALLRDALRWKQNHAQRQRLLTEHEKNLRLAARPPAIFAVLWALTAMLPDGGAPPPPPPGWEHYSELLHAFFGIAAYAITGALLIAGLVTCAVGVWRCAGVRDGILTLRAVIWLAVGGALMFWVRTWPVTVPADTDGVVAAAGDALRLVGLWLLVGNGVRFLLLTVPTSGALTKVRRAIDRNRNQWRSARP
jgi:hypothetical protein